MMTQWPVLAVGGPGFSVELDAVLSPVALVQAGPSELGAVLEQAREVEGVIIDADAVEVGGGQGRLLLAAVRAQGKFSIVVSSRHERLDVARAATLGADDYVLRPYNHREFIARFLAVQVKKIRVCCLGGGTGLF
ncbi:MAG: response regulator, partial [Myxococcaceae bacterium]